MTFCRMPLALASSNFLRLCLLDKRSREAANKKRTTSDTHTSKFRVKKHFCPKNVIRRDDGNRQHDAEAKEVVVG